MSDEKPDDYVLIIVDDENGENAITDVLNIKQEIEDYPANELDFAQIQQFLNQEFKTEPKDVSTENLVQEDENFVEEYKSLLKKYDFLVKNEMNNSVEENEDSVQEDENSVSEDVTAEEDYEDVLPGDFENNSKNNKHKRKKRDIEFNITEQIQIDSKYIKNIKKKTKKKNVKRLKVSTKNKKGKTRKEMRQGSRWRRPDPASWTSRVQTLREQDPDMNEEDLIKLIAIEMIDLEPPPLPDNAYTEFEEGFECSECNTTKKFKGHIERHWQTYHGPRYCVCYSCGADFRCKDALYRHEKKCKALDAALVLKARAIQVASQQKPRNGIIPEITVPHKYHYCKYCPEFFPLKAALVCHMKKHEARSEYNMEVANKRYKCSFCEISYDEEKDLLLHHRMHMLGRPYQCTLCPKAYISNEALQKHIPTHTDVRYECTHCNRLFKRQKGLAAHLPTHEEPQYFCVECPKRFTFKASLITHVERKHLHIPSPFGCQICFMSFSRFSYLKRHMMDRHSINIMTKLNFIQCMPNMTEEEISDVIIFHPEQNYSIGDWLASQTKD